MLTGLKSNSDLLFISQTLDMPDGGSANQLTVSLPLNTLERQVFVVTDVVAYVTDSANQSSAVPNQDIDYSWSLSSTDLSQTLAAAFAGDIGNPRVLAAGGYKLSIGASGAMFTREWNTANASTGTPSDYLGIIATPDYFIRGQYNNAAGIGSAQLQIRLVGFMAIASADTYAALVTQEVNSQ